MPFRKGYLKSNRLMHPMLQTKAGLVSSFGREYELTEREKRRLEAPIMPGSRATPAFTLLLWNSWSHGILSVIGKFAIKKVPADKIRILPRLIFLLDSSPPQERIRNINMLRPHVLAQILPKPVIGACGIVATIQMIMQ
jgi:hypothetical protein